MNRLRDNAREIDARKSQIHSELQDAGALQCNGERPTLEMMEITAERLEHIERQLWGIHALLFGAEPVDAACSPPHPEPSIKWFASQAFGSSVSIDRICEDIRYRLRGN